MDGCGVCVGGGDRSVMTDDIASRHPPIPNPKQTMAIKYNESFAFVEVPEAETQVLEAFGVTTEDLAALFLLPAAKVRFCFFFVLFFCCVFFNMLCICLFGWWGLISVHVFVWLSVIEPHRPTNPTHPSHNLQTRAPRPSRTWPP